MRQPDQAFDKALGALRAGDAAGAVRLCRRLLRKRASDVEVLKLLGHGLIMAGQPAQAAQEAAKVNRLAPRDAEAWIIRGHADLECRNASEACRHLQTAVDLDPRNPSAWHELALARSLAGANTQALVAFTRAYELAPEIPNYRDNYLLALIMNGHPEHALELCRGALTGEPGHAGLLHLLGQAQLMLGDLRAASETLERALVHAPTSDAIAQTLGTCLSMLNDSEKALPLLLRAAGSGTQRPSLQWIVARTLAEASRVDEALAWLRKLHANHPGALGPDLARLLNLLISADRLVEATSLLELAQASLPGEPDVLGQAAHLALRRSRPDEARTHLDAALVSRPGDDRLLRYREALLLATGCAREALATARRRNDANAESDPQLGGSLLDLNYLDDVDPELVYEAHLEWARAVTRRIPPATPAFDNERDPSRRLRIGYLSPDLKGHSVASFFEPLIRHHDRTACAIHCYYSGTRIDPVTNRIRAVSDQWRQVHAEPDDLLATSLRTDGIDILVDLAGHTKGHRLEVFARRAAPVQVTWLGYPNTTGLETMDYRLCDPVSDPEGSHASRHSESLFRLPNGFLCFEGPDIPLPERNPDRGPVTFGSFNNLSKVTATTLRLWGRVLAQVADARLLLKAKQLSDRLIRQDLLQRLAAAGFDTGRVELHGRLEPKEAHLGLYGQVDIALDTVPYNGTTTTCQALWMGTPVIALRGDRHAARVGASILTHADLPELIGEDEDDFVARAVALARDRSRLVEYHTGLRGHLERSRLCDAEGFARQVESAYRAMWHAYLERTAGS